MFSLQCPLLTHRLLMALSCECTNFQLGQLVQTSQHSRVDSTIHKNKATKRHEQPSKNDKSGNLEQEDLNYSGEPAIQKIHFGYTYIYCHEQTSYRRKLSSWVLTTPHVGIRKKKF